MWELGQWFSTKNNIRNFQKTNLMKDVFTDSRMVKNRGL